jgi:hypothetical protein
MKKTIWVVAAALVGLSLISTASATPVYQYTFDTSNYTLLPIDTVAVPVYITETVGLGDTSVFAPGNPNTQGLTNAGVRLSFLPVVPGTPSTVTSLSSIVGNPQFDDSNVAYLAHDSTSTPGMGIAEINPPGTNAVAGSANAVFFLTDPVVGTATGPNSYRILVGTFTFQAGAPFSVTTIQAGDLFSNQIDTVTASGVALDSLIQAGSFTITVVPEPASWALAMMGLVIGGVVVLRRSSAATEARD